MKSILFSLTLLIGTLFSAPAFAGSATPAIATAPSLAGQHALPGDLTEEELLTLKPKEIAARTGQKMNFLERLAFRSVQKKLKKQKARAAKGKGTKATGLGTASLVMGILATVFLLSIFVTGIGILLAVLFGGLGTVFGAIARSNGDRSGTATAGMIMSIVSGGLALLLLILAVAVIAAWL